MTLNRIIARYGRVDLLCIDELGYMELDKRGAELLIQVLTEREEKSSVAIALNDSFSGWPRRSPTSASAPIPNVYRTIEGVPVPRQDFLRLTRIPNVVYYGDNIPTQPSDVPAQDFWRASLQMARRWAKLVNRYGGNATVVHLPERGVEGNTHFLFSDLNNEEVADNSADGSGAIAYADPYRTRSLVGTAAAGLGRAAALVPAAAAVAGSVPLRTCARSQHLRTSWSQRCWHTASP